MRNPFDFGLPAALIAVTSLLACGARGTAKPAEPPAPASKPGEPREANLDAMLARESEGLAERELSGKGFRAKVMVKGEPTVEEESGVPKLVLPIGSEAPIHCFIYKDDPDPGSALAVIVSSLKKELELARVEPGPIEVVREAPVATLSGMYTASTPKGRAVGELKVAFHSRFGSSSMCLHDELGYTKTFMQVARSVFGSLERGVEPVSPSYVEIMAAEINGHPAGYERMLVLPEQSGERKLVATGLALLLTGPTDLLAQDYASIVSIDAHDRLTKGRWKEAKNGDLLLDLELSRRAGKSYEYAGKSAGKALSGKFSSKDEQGLPSPLWTQKELARRLDKGGAFEFAIEQEYRPSEEPALLSSIAYARRAEDPPHTVLVKMDKVEARSTLDGQGHEERSEMSVQGLNVVMKRIYRRGQP